MTTIRQLSTEDKEDIKTLFFEIFSNEPWNDDWSDPIQLEQYITDLTGNSNSLSVGLFKNKKLIGLALGYILHWYSGTEYYIFEFCIKKEFQNKGLGTAFLKMIEEHAKHQQINHIFLQTEKTVPAYNFYKKNGFTELSDHVSFYRNFDT